MGECTSQSWGPHVPDLRMGLHTRVPSCKSDDATSARKPQGECLWRKADLNKFDLIDRNVGQKPGN